jgi:CheY-like chemotaxis protein
MEPAVVLVVDDTYAKRYLRATWLRQAGYTVVEAATGLEALSRLAGVDLVVLDIRLPDISGIEVCERMRASPRTASIPVIQVSVTAIAVAERAAGLDNGADAYLPEPIEPAEFLATVRAVLRSYRARHRSEQAAARLAALARATLAVNAAETFDRLACTAAEGAADIFGVAAGLMMMLPTGRLCRVFVSPPQAPHQQGGPVALAESLAGRVLLTGPGNAAAMIPWREWLRLVPDTRMTADVYLAVSRTKAGRAPVAMCVDHAGIVGEEDRLILGQLAQTTALAVEALRAYAEEHLIALVLQRSFLPAGLPEIPGVQMSARYVPASDQAQVGGDFYEVLEVPGYLLAAIGDVQGHSLDAATVMGEMRHALRAFADAGHPAQEIASLLNSVLQRYHPDIIATLCLVQLEVATGELQIVNCGHMAPLLVADARAVYCGEGGMLLGTPIDAPHVEHAVLPRGGMLVLFTDGLVEGRGGAMDANLEQLRLAAEGATGDTDAFADHVLGIFGPREDDVALVVLRRT